MAKEQRSVRAVMVLSENFTLLPPTDIRGMVDLAVTAEQCGVDTVMLSEHIVLGPDSCASGLMHNPRDYAAPGNQDPATAWPDSAVLAAAILTRTTRLRVALSAVITPLRHPLQLAKQWSTLDLLGSGRLVVQPYRALGVDFRTRGAILDEQLEALSSLWSAPPGQPSSHHGRFYSYENVWSEPRPPQPISMWFGGERLSDVLIRRIVRYGSGFNPFGTPTADERLALDNALRAAGRDPESVELIGGIRGVFQTPDGPADLDVALATLPEKVASGYRSICFKPSMFTDDRASVGDVCRRVVRALDEQSK